MRTAQIEPGGIYAGRSGHPREVVRFVADDSRSLYYRTIFRNYKGPLMLTRVYQFAAWARRELPDYKTARSVA